MTQQEATENLFEAAKNGDIAAAMAAMAAGGQINAHDGEYNTPLHLAAANGHSDLARLLVEEHGAALHAVNKSHHTPSSSASWNGHGELGRLLYSLDPYYDKDRMRNKVSNIGMLASSIVSLGIIAGLFYLADRNTIKSPTPNNKIPAANEVERENQIRSILKDPAFTDRLIEQLKDQAIVEKFTNDPEVMQNLQKVADAIDGRAKRALEQEEALDDTISSKWTKKAIQLKPEQNLKRE